MLCFLCFVFVLCICPAAGQNPKSVAPRDLSGFRTKLFLLLGGTDSLESEFKNLLLILFRLRLSLEEVDHC